MSSTSIVGRSACHIDSSGARTGCQVTRELGHDQVEVKGKGGAAGQRWTCPRAALEVIPVEWTRRWPHLY